MRQKEVRVEKTEKFKRKPSLSLLSLDHSIDKMVWSKSVVLLMKTD